ncbi:MAG: flagellar motor protein MotD [Azoarcus sp.]|nr:flagellar motor protein MotD [Azoarcus sp.]
MPRRRRKPADEHHENHERWLVSYADFITLLFAFFVVMYSLSSVNEGKYRVLSDSLLSAFRSVTVNQANEQIVVPPIVVPDRPQPRASNARGEQGDGTGSEVEPIRRMAESIRRVLEPLTRTGQVNISEGAHGITVEVNANVLFSGGDATIDEAGREPLLAVAEVFAGSEFPVTIEGHTDDRPISTPRFPSNWELSAARASAVVRLFEAAGVEAARLSAIGYADQRPITENLTAEGRARNRRVTVRLDAMYNDPPPRAPATIRPSDPMRAILP